MDSKVKKTPGDSKHIYKNELDKGCLAHDAPNANSIDLAKKAVSDTILKERAYESATNPKYDGYQRVVYKLFDKKVGSEGIVNRMLAQELNKPGIKKIKRRKLYARLRDNV